MSHRDLAALSTWERGLTEPPAREVAEFGPYVCRLPGPRGCGYCRGCEEWADRALDYEREDPDGY